MDSAASPPGLRKSGQNAKIALRFWRFARSKNLFRRRRRRKCLTQEFAGSFVLFVFLIPCQLFSTLSAQGVQPQDDYFSVSIQRHDFNRQKWEALKEGIDYSKPDQPPQKKEGEGSSFQGFGQAFKWFFIAAAIVLLILLVVHLIGGKDLFGPRDRKIKASVSGIDLESIEENLLQAELDGPIRRAVDAGDYALAIRLYYLVVLKELSLKKHIRWKRDKTNGEYLRELGESPLFHPVQEATLAYERVWYGKAELNQQDFFSIESTFKSAVAAVGK
jgi:hypothetical protein